MLRGSGAIQSFWNAPKLPEDLQSFLNPPLRATLGVCAILWSLLEFFESLGPPLEPSGAIRS
eukprot:2354779-Alexandrium_andersonii.AAC.1